MKKFSKIFAAFLLLSLCTFTLEAKTVAERLLSANAVKSVVKADTFALTKGVMETDLEVIKTDGEPLRLYVVEADLTLPSLSLEVATPGDTCAASGNSRATISDMTLAADRPGHRVIAMANADFWNTRSMDVLGPLHRRGETVKNHFDSRQRLSEQAISFVGVFDNGDMAIDDTIAYHGAAPRLLEATGAGMLLLKYGMIQNIPSNSRHPRTFIGYTTGGKVVIVAADGRDPGKSVGLNYVEQAKIMQALGCSRAVNLDGGGSTQLLTTRADGTMAIRNHPSDGHERKVVNAWMIVEK